MQEIILILTMLFGHILGPKMTGTASQYGPGRMAEVVANRQAGRTEYPLPQELPPVHGYIAVRDCDQVGGLWLIQPEGGKLEVFLVTDCPCYGDGTIFWMLANNIIVEIDHQTAERWDAVGGGIAVTARELLP